MRRIDGYKLWIGNSGDVRDARPLLDEGIEAVIDLAAAEQPAHLPRELVYCRFPLVDGGGNSAGLLSCAVLAVSALLRANVPTLVFCGAGMSRSPAIAAVALAHAREMPIQTALEHICAAGAVDVSPGLWAELQTVMLSARS